jgi:hypothetical protein
MASRQPYVQWLKSKQCWRFRRRVPDRLCGLIGQTECTEILPKYNRTEADRLAIPYIDQTNQVIQPAKRGNWPLISDDEIEVLAIGWREWFRGGPIKRWIDRCGGNEPFAFASNAQLMSMRKFIA